MQLRLFSDSANFIIILLLIPLGGMLATILDSIYIVHPVSEMKLDDYIVSL